MANGLLSAIANPQLGGSTGIPQAFAAGQEQTRVREEQERTGQARDLAGQILGQTFTGKLGQLAQLDPKRAADIAEWAGIPTDSKGRLDNFLGVIVAADRFAQTDTNLAAQYLDEEATKIESATGESTAANKMREFIQRLTQDPEGAKADLNAMAVNLQPKTETKPTKVQSSEILGDGTTIQVMADGTTNVTDAAGNTLSGNDRTEAIREAREKDVKQKRQIARAGALGSGIAKTSVDRGNKAFDTLQKTRANIRNLDKVVAAIDKGAKTGAVQKFLPSIQAASVELDQLRGELGLDIVGATTFGALSESELEFALDVALPTGLDEPELKDWALRKKSAQEKLAKELSQAARHFSLGGTIDSFLNIKERERNQAQPDGQETITVDF